MTTVQTTNDANAPASDCVHSTSNSHGLLDVRGLCVDVPDAQAASRWPGQQPAQRRLLDQVDLQLHAGQAVGVIGESGSGKSTLARALTLLMPPQHGQVLFEGRSVLGLHGTALVDYRAQMQLVFQDPMSALNPRLPVGVSVSRPAQVLGLLTGLSAAALAALMLEKVGLSPSLAERYPHELSGGQRQRINIARALALRPRALIADEITSGLDVSAQARIVVLLRQLCAQDSLGLIFISHDLSLVRSLCDHIVLLQAGRVVESASTERLFNAPEQAYTRRLLDAIPLPVPDAHWLDRL